MWQFKICSWVKRPTKFFRNSLKQPSNINKKRLISSFKDNVRAQNFRNRKVKLLFNLNTATKFCVGVKEKSPSIPRTSAKNCKRCWISVTSWSNSWNGLRRQLWGLGSLEIRTVLRSSGASISQKLVQNIISLERKSQAECGGPETRRPWQLGSEGAQLCFLGLRGIKAINKIT